MYVYFIDYFFYILDYVLILFKIFSLDIINFRSLYYYNLIYVKCFNIFGYFLNLFYYILCFFYCLVIYLLKVFYTYNMNMSIIKK